ncbi:MAG: hypothetical protein MZV63_14240 [Marinilabiliales bacterium]|nr:hypothetical protein [Marinilabiliales bacterium]
MIAGFGEMRTFVGRIDPGTGEIKEIFPSDKDAREELCHGSSPGRPDGRIVYCVHGDPSDSDGTLAFDQSRKTFQRAGLGMSTR